MSIGRRLYMRRYRKDNPDKVRCRALRSKYKITLAEWQALFAWQGSVCAACGSDEPKNKKGWQTDHDHETGTVRAILCSPCNLAIGQAQHDPSRLRLLAEYLENYMRNFP